MSSAFHLIFTSVFFVNVIVGMTLNGFIVLMNCKTWLRNKRLPPGDTIVTSLCLSRWIFQCLVSVHLSLEFLVPRNNFSKFFTPLRILMNYVSIWFAGLLCVYYCVKIASYKNAAFLYLKARMTKLVPWCLGLSVFLSLVFIQPYVWNFFTSDHKADVFPNVTRTTDVGSYIYFIGSSPPFVIFMGAFFLTVPSLWRHIRNMSGPGASLRNPDMKTHYNAIKSMAAFFLLHALFIVIVNVNLSGLLTVGTLFIPLTSMLISFYPCLHSAIIIFYNRKLGQAFLAPLKCVKRFSRRSCG